MLISLHYILKPHVFALGCSRRPGGVSPHLWGDVCSQIKKNVDDLFHNIRWLWFPEGGQSSSEFFCSLLVFAVFWPSMSRVCWPSVSRIGWVARRLFREILSRLIEVWTHLVSVYNSCVAASVRFWISCALWHVAKYLGHHRRRWCTSRADLSSLLNVEKTFESKQVEMKTFW